MSERKNIPQVGNGEKVAIRKGIFYPISLAFVASSSSASWPPKLSTTWKTPSSTSPSSTSAGFSDLGKSFSLHLSFLLFF